MKIAPLHLNRLGNDVTARLENKPDSIALHVPKGKECRQHPCKVSSLLSLLSGHPGLGCGVFCFRMRKGYEEESPQAVTKQTLWVLWHLVAGAKKGMCLVILLCRIARAIPQGPGFPCQGKGPMLPGNSPAKGMFFQSPAAQWGALGAAPWALLESCQSWIWLQRGGTVATLVRQEHGEQERRPCQGPPVWPPARPTGLSCKMQNVSILSQGRMFLDVRHPYTFKPNQQKRRPNQWNSQLPHSSVSWKLTGFRDVIIQDVDVCLCKHCYVGKILHVCVS